MKKILRSQKLHLCVFLVLLTGWANSLRAQTNPAGQDLPFSFTAISASTLPDGIAVHSFGNSSAGTTGAVPLTRTLAPAILDLAYSTNTTNSGGWLGSDNGIAMLASNAQKAGAVVVAINTTGKSNIKVEWTARAIYLQDSRDNSLALQYRLGTDGNFTDLGDASHVFTTTGKSAGDNSSFSLTLPAALENQSLVQLRWVYLESAGTSGSRDRIALDDVTIAEDVPEF